MGAGDGGGAEGDGRNGVGLGRVRDWSRRRKVVASVLLVLLVGVVTLLAIVPMDVLALVVTGSATFEASPAGPTDEVASDHGYELTGTIEFVVKEEISPAGRSRTAVAKNQRRTYEHAFDVQNESDTAAQFTVVTTPAIEVAGEARNPIAGLSHGEILEEYGSEVGGEGRGQQYERVGTHEAVLLGNSVTVTEFETSVTVDGETRAVAVYVTTTQSKGDVVVAVGVHPRAFPDERVSFFELLDAVEHPAE